MTQPTPVPPLNDIIGRYTLPLLELGETLPYDVWHKNPDRAYLGDPFGKLRTSLDSDDHHLITPTDLYVMSVNRLISNGLTPGGVVTLLHRANYSVSAWRFELFLRALRASRDALYVSQMTPFTLGITGLSASKAHKWASQAYKAQRAAVEAMAVDSETDLIVPIVQQLERHSLARQVETDLNTITLILDKERILR